MNFKKLVEDGTYSIDELTTDQKAYIEGMQAALESIENAKADYNIMESDTIIEQMKCEIIDEFIDELKEYISWDIAQMIVVFGDENYVEKENKNEQKL